MCLQEEVKQAGKAIHLMGASVLQTCPGIFPPLPLLIVLVASHKVKFSNGSITKEKRTPIMFLNAQYYMH